jgi:hypothetical protein
VLEFQSAIEAERKNKFTTGHRCRDEGCRIQSSYWPMVDGLVFWPDGLRLFLSSDISNAVTNAHEWQSLEYDYFGYVVYSILLLGHHDSLELLSGAGCPVYPFAWFQACECRLETEMLSKLVCSMMNRRHSSSVVESRHDTCREPVSFLYCNTAYVREFWDVSFSNLYHTRDLSLEAARCLWEAGFKDVDNLSGFYQEDVDTSATPLWIQARIPFSPETFRFPRFSWGLIEWLVEKGAMLNWVHPSLQTTPAHLIASNYACERQYHEIEASKRIGCVNGQFVEFLLHVEHVDQCLCYCSDSGCRVLGCAVKSFERFPPSTSTRQRFQEPNLDPVFQAVDLKRLRSAESGLAVIRTLTFDKLGMTHTCCVRLITHGCKQTEEELQDISYMESKDINLLESLMVDFEHTWAEHAGTSKEYIETVWKPRMEDEIGHSSKEVDLDTIERIQEIGVNLWEPFGPEVGPLEQAVED